MQKMRGFIMLWLALVSPVLAADGPLTYGVFPYVSRGKLVEDHDPLRLFLQQKLARQLDFVTAPDFPEFLARTSRGEYDIVFTAPHLARFAQQRDGYRLLARTDHSVQGIFLVRSDSGLRTLADLKGKRVMMAQPLSILYQMASDSLSQQGLKDKVNVTILATRTHDNALAAPMRGEADASVTGYLLWEAADAEAKAALRKIDETAKVPGFIMMVHKRVPAADLQKIDKALFDFGKTPAGEEFFRSTGFQRFHAMDERTARSLDPYTKILVEHSAEK